MAWEWLRRDPLYRAAAGAVPEAESCLRCADPRAHVFGLVGFEAPNAAVPHALPMWRSEVHPSVLRVDRGSSGREEDELDLDRLTGFMTRVRGLNCDHLLLSDGLRMIRLDGPSGVFEGRPRLRYALEGIATIGPQLLTLRQFIALYRAGWFARSLHPIEPRGRRWTLMLRAWDALCAGAGQREIAEVLLGRSAAEPRWRSHASSLRSQVQRLVRSARWFAAGGHRILLADRTDARTAREY